MRYPTLSQEGIIIYGSPRRGARIENCAMTKSTRFYSLEIEQKLMKNRHCLAVRTEIQTGNFFILPDCDVRHCANNCGKILRENARACCKLRSISVHRGCKTRPACARFAVQYARRLQSSRPSQR